MMMLMTVMMVGDDDEDNGGDGDDDTDQHQAPRALPHPVTRLRQQERLARFAQNAPRLAARAATNKGPSGHSATPTD